MVCHRGFNFQEMQAFRGLGMRIGKDMTGSPLSASVEVDSCQPDDKTNEQSLNGGTRELWRWSIIITK
jgi:hypothetical protein